MVNYRWKFAAIYLENIEIFINFVPDKYLPFVTVW